ncbi:type II restriction endonuclease, TdeIII family [Campylobacter avium LMG 24591]|uniref:type II site-specific deoxyribonuclease n=1 Tax=Campylobacter avium LMG 24591 TaxID=522484 RepID=A0A222MZN2_9BACT|nr:TdeIII family type II restriction endonuclease [Campylobacter avium]ASQ31305.1 type II restriction endonuclease, TdeIII family [Campylobacter avium LMG 24591]OYD79979.1 type II restriction endonuclease, TdeIII family [Campylobacter avium]
MLKEKIKARLSSALRQKFTNYKPESAFMPFHTRLLGKDRMALYSFIQSLNTNFGTSIFEPVAEELALQNFDVVKRQVEAGSIITKEAQRVIQDIMDSLESGNSKPCKADEMQKILAVAKSGEVSEIKPTKVDLFLQKDKNVYLIDIKTAKPNKGGFKEFKRTLLTWVASFAHNNPNIDIHALIAIPYNPYEPKPYQRWTMAGMLDLDSELKVASEFWDFLGGNSSYKVLLEAFEEVGCEMRNEIDEYFKRFEYR